jgi:hypothetical protein
VAAHVQQALESYLHNVPGVTLILIARVSLEPTSVVNILLATPGNLPSGIKADLTRLVHKERGDDPIVRVLVLREVQEKQESESIP